MKQKIECTIEFTIPWDGETDPGKIIDALAGELPDTRNFSFMSHWRAVVGDVIEATVTPVMRNAGIADKVDRILEGEGL